MGKQFFFFKISILIRICIFEVLKEKKKKSTREKRFEGHLGGVLQLKLMVQKFSTTHTILENFKNSHS